MIESSMVKLLVETAVLAAGRGLSAESDRIFTALRHLRPNDSHVAIFQGFAFLASGQYDRAIEALRPQSEGASEEAELSRCYLGMALQQKGQKSEAEPLLQSVLRSAGSMQARGLAAELLAR